MISTDRSKRKPSGGKVKAYRKKKLYENASNPTLTKIDQKAKNRVVRGRGGNTKIRAITVTHANVYDSKQKKYVKTKIVNEVENSANRNFVRRNILNKGSVIVTEAGKAKITSRPGQDGVINAVLVDE